MGLIRSFKGPYKALKGPYKAVKDIIKDNQQTQTHGSNYIVSAKHILFFISTEIVISANTKHNPNFNYL